MSDPSVFPIASFPLNFRGWWQQLRNPFGTASSALVQASLCQLIKPLGCRVCLVKEPFEADKDRGPTILILSLRVGQFL